MLSNIYLENSYVLAVDERENSLVFELELVLGENHTKYKKPLPGQMYCYIRVLLRFLNVESLEWISRRFMAYEDSSGDIDYGNIDSFVVLENGYKLAGDWGEVIIKGQHLEVAIDDLRYL